MKKYTVLLLGALICTLSFANSLSAQNAEDILFTVGGEGVDKSEFEYVYQKNNPGKENDYSRESIEEYLDLYINFKLKVKEARTLQIDTLPSVQAELERYRKQLVKSYYDKAVTNKLLEQAYTRMLEEVQISHVMVAVKAGASPEDTAAAWKKINEMRAELLKGANMEQMAMTRSEDPTAKTNKGNLGYLTALMIPEKSFEDAMYETPVGQYSKVLRTRFGYHVIRPGERRPNSGKVKVAHILVRFKAPQGKKVTPGVRDAASKKAWDLYRQITEQGASFDSLATVASDDKNTARNAGLLPEFGTGKMIASFEKTAFALQDPGQVSEPVETQYGFHIIKLIEKKPMAGYDELKPELTRLLQRTGRTEKARKKYISSVKNKYNFTENQAVLDTFTAGIDSSIIVNTWRARKASHPSDTIMMLGDRSYSIGDLALVVERSQRAYRSTDIAEKIDRLNRIFVDESVIEYGLTKEYEDFRRLLKEYRDGILLFELTEDVVWSRALEDTTGLLAYYEGHKDNFMWDTRVNADIFTVSNPKKLKKIRKSAEKGESAADMLTSFNGSGTDTILWVESGIFLKGQNELIDHTGLTKGLGKDEAAESGMNKFVRVNEVIEPTPKTLAEAKGYVISDYQDYLEKQWVSDLKEKYQVIVNTPVLNSLIQ